MTAEIHVIIVNYRSAELVRRCLESLTDAGVSSVTVVDNDSGSDDRVALGLLEQRNRILRVVSSAENLGFGAGVNLGVSVSDTSGEDFLWILNPDTVVEASAPRLMASVLSQGLADIVSPVIETGDASARSLWFAGGWIDFRRGVAWHTEELPSLSTNNATVYETRYITGAAPMMTRSTWDLLGGFREDLFLYWEDVDLCVRAMEMGLRLGVARDARIWHAQGGSTGHVRGGMSDMFYYFGQRNRLVVCGARVSRVSLTFGTGIRETARLLLKPLLLESPPRLSKTWGSFRGLVDGWRGVTGRGPY